MCDDFIGRLAAPPSRNDPILLEPVQHSQGGGAVKHTLWALGCEELTRLLLNIRNMVELARLGWGRRQNMT